LKRGEDFFVIVEESPGDRLDIEGAVELIGNGGDGRLAVRQFVEAEGQFAQAFNGGAGCRASFVGQRAEFDFAVGSLACPGEGKLAGVLGDVAEEVLGVSGLERTLHGAAGGDSRKPIPRPDDAIDRQTRKLRHRIEGDARSDGRAKIERARHQAARRAPVEGLAE
jgi:hypothetical protein